MKQQIPVNLLRGDKEPVQIVHLGKEMPYDFRRPHRHDYLEFFVFERGGGQHYIDFTAYPICSGSVHVVFPGQVHLLKRTEAQGIIIICRKDFINLQASSYYEHLYRNNLQIPCIEFSDAAFVDLLSTIEHLELELGSKQVFSYELASSYLAVFMVSMIRAFAKMEVRKKASEHTLMDIERYQKFLSLLETHFIERQNVAFYASKLHLTPKALNNSIRKLTGNTCLDLIQERTLTEAKRLLLFTTDSSKEIAFALNFKDDSYFTRFFTKMEGQTPKEFKSYWEEKYHS